MKKELEKQFSDAIKLQEAGHLEPAKNLLLKLAGDDPQSLRILAALGLVYYELGDLNEALAVFKRGIELYPALEAMSKGLFHSLWNLGRRDEALEEIKRFQAIADSEDYREIVKEINEKFD